MNARTRSKSRQDDNIFISKVFDNVQIYNGCPSLQDKSMSLEPHEFKMCLISLGYNLKEGEKVSYCSYYKTFFTDPVEDLYLQGSYRLWKTRKVIISLFHAMSLCV